MSKGTIGQRRKVNKEERKSRCGFCTGEKKVRENTEIKENVVSQNMKGRKLHRGKVCPVWENGLGCETIFPSLSLTLCACLHLCSYSFKPSSYPFHGMQPHTPPLLPIFPFFPHSIHPRRCCSMSGRRGQKEGFGGS